eukprot:TRINITY_DN3055_c0_g1_i1.p5 TRINITY_DN3055_c0_g1~~TRINITY_DN3055_c0_g1_i1.p5  ORF type:complete len:199 (-),score=-17.06 TRINITY_DN3055_c0_g1_i1:964-1560(-)
MYQGVWKWIIWKWIILAYSTYRNLINIFLQIQQFIQNAIQAFASLSFFGSLSKSLYFQYYSNQHQQSTFKLFYSQIQISSFNGLTNLYIIYYKFLTNTKKNLYPLEYILYGSTQNAAQYLFLNLSNAPCLTCLFQYYCTAAKPAYKISNTMQAINTNSIKIYKLKNCVISANKYMQQKITQFCRANLEEIAENAKTWE